MWAFLHLVKRHKIKAVAATAKTKSKTKQSIRTVEFA